MPAASRPGHRAAAGRVRVAVTLAAGAALLVAGCASGPPPELKPSQASEKVSDLLLADPAMETCFADAFAAGPDAAAGLNIDVDKLPTRSQIDATKALLRSCVTPEVQAKTIGLQVAEAFPDAPPSALDCIRSTILGLTPQDQDTLLLGMVNQVPEGPVFAETLSSKLIAPCNLQNFLPPDLGGGVPGLDEPGDTTPAQVSGSAVTATR